jgi:FkbM family methyltransferase
MADPKDLVGKAVLHAPSWLRSVRNVPVLGRLVHGLSHKILPADKRIWAKIEQGPAQGLWLQVNPRVADSLIQGRGEVDTQRVLAERLQPGMIFFDLGANIGLFTLLAARLVGESGKVFSFEPDHENALRLRANVARNNFNNVTIVEAGVWSTSGNLKFVPGPASSPDRAWGKFLPPDQTSDGVSTPCLALDDFIKAVPSPDGIKCDVEGAEVEALRGAETLLNRARPWVLCETHSPENNRAVREFLARLGYQLQTMDETHLLAFREGY